jgi:hypothetical protein
MHLGELIGEATLAGSHRGVPQGHILACLDLKVLELGSVPLCTVVESVPINGDVDVPSSVE